MNRVLILHGGGGLGHVKAGEAVLEALKKNYPLVEAKNVDALDFGPPTFKKIYNESYDFLSTKIPELWRLVYKHFNENGDEANITGILPQLLLEKRFISFIHSYQPDFIISSHPLPIQLLSYAKREGLIRVPSANIITDFICHRLWVNGDVNLYFVAHEETKKDLQNLGVEEEKIIVSGIPISIRFQKTFDKKALKKKFGFHPREPVFLMVGGRLRFHDIEKIIRSFSGLSKSIGCIVIAGRDFELEKKLRKEEFPNFVKIFGFVDCIEEAMGASDVILTKSGGLTVSECLAMALPMILYKVIPGQEEGNMEFLLRRGLGIKVQSPKEVSACVLHLFQNPGKLRSLSEACRKAGKPHAAFDIAQNVMRYG